MLNQAETSINIQRRTRPLDVAVFCAASDEVQTHQIDPSGRVSKIGIASNGAPDIHGSFATHGMVDLQVNGFAGIDFNRPGVTPEQLDKALCELARTGVTRLLPTLITGTASHLKETLRDLDTAVTESELGPYMVAGYHIEGPFLSPAEGYSGAHNADKMSAASLTLFDELDAITTRPVRLVTVAPEVDGVLGMIPDLTARGVQVSLGHTAANLQQIEAAVASGAMLCTHLGNGLPQTLHKTENQIFWQLAQDDLTAMFIADGIHVPRAALQTMLRAKGCGRSILTTDAVAAAGLTTRPGPYTLGNIDVELSDDGVVRVPGSSYLAGSSVTMDQMLRNVTAWYGCTISEILQMAQLNPARILGLRETSPTAHIVEWHPSPEGPRVKATHIGPFTIT